jgi:hypothetical protein
VQAREARTVLASWRASLRAAKAAALGETLTWLRLAQAAISFFLFSSFCFILSCRAFCARGGQVADRERMTERAFCQNTRHLVGLGQVLLSRLGQLHALGVALDAYGRARAGTPLRDASHPSRSVHAPWCRRSSIRACSTR